MCSVAIVTKRNNVLPKSIKPIYNSEAVYDVLTVRPYKYVFLQELLESIGIQIYRVLVVIACLR